MASAIRFLIGGLIVVAVSLITKAAPFLSGILSGFPAVFLTSLIFVYLSSGTCGLQAFTSTATWGMVATLFAVAGTIGASYGHWPWPFVIVAGLMTYGVFVSLAMVYTAKKDIISMR